MEFAAEDAVEFWPSFPGENLPPFTMCRCTLSSSLSLFSWRHTQVRLSNCRQRYASRENYNNIEREYRIAKRIAGGAGEKKAKRRKHFQFNAHRKYQEAIFHDSTGNKSNCRVFGYFPLGCLNWHV